MKKIFAIFILMSFLIGGLVTAQENTASSGSFDAVNTIVNSNAPTIIRTDSNRGIAAVPIKTGLTETPTQTAVQTVASFEESVKKCFEEQKKKNPDKDDESLWAECKKRFYAPKVVHAVASRVPIPECEKINSDLKKELKEVLEKYELAKKEGNAEKDLSEIQDYIKRLRKKIEDNKARCWQPEIIKAVQTNVKQECEIEYERLRNELAGLYKKLELNKKENIVDEELKKQIAELEKKIQDKNKECFKQPEPVRVTPSNMVVETTRTGRLNTAIKPENIATYYQAELDSILSKKESLDEQIASLKALRKKIDDMILELFKKKNSVRAESFNGLVEEFNIKPDEIIADDVKVKATNKEIIKKIEDKEVKIKTTGKKVLLNVDDFEVKVPEVKLKDRIQINDVELKVLPDKILRKIKKEKVKDAEINKEGEKLVYNIKTEEERKILGLFKVKAEKKLKFDATTENANLIKEEKPWWYGLSTSAEK